jgi:alkylation response protein AidB-like acyl-CoA dehydrogenase
VPAHLEEGAEGSASFRRDFSEFLLTHAPGRAPKDPASRREWQQLWAQTLVEAGFACPSWPQEWGGMALSLMDQVVYHEEVAKARAPGQPPGETIIGPTLMKFGTEAQKHRYLPRIRSFEERWCLGYSEPSAGSDLVSLRTRAVRVGDEYVINGQKVWTSGSTTADFMVALVRTGTEEERQNGITYLIVPMHAEGIDVRPIRDMAGDSGFAEVFLDDVRVSVENRVGEEGAGWIVARTALGLERSTANTARDLGYRRVVDELIQLARDSGRSASPLVRQELAKLETQVRLLHLNNVRALSTILQGQEPGPESSITRLMHSRFEQRLHEVAVDITGSAGMLSRGPYSVQGGRWVWGFLRTRASTIGAGTTEVQRNLISERVLGLPYDPSMPAPAN